MRRWVALTGLLELLAAAAPGAVTIDAKKHCEVVDWSKKAVPVTLDPGEYYAEVVSGAISYGRTLGKLRCQLLMAADPIAVDCYGTDEYPDAPAAYFCEVQWTEGVGVGFRVRRRTTVRFFMVDGVVAGNSGAVNIAVRKGGYDGPKVATVRVDAVKNCYEPTFKRAYKLVLEPGVYHLRVVSGNVQFEQSEAARSRQCASVMFDFNPRQVGMDFHETGGLGDRMIGNWAISGRADLLPIRVRQKTTIPIYFLDDSPANNSGSVTISVKSAEPYWQ